MDESEDNPVMVFDSLPDGITADYDNLSLISPEAVTWTVFDEVHMYYNTSQYGSFTDRYTGTTYTGEVLSLKPGMYSITVGDSKFLATVYGQVDLEKNWTYNLDGENVNASISYSIQVSELVSEFAYADRLNMDDNAPTPKYRSDCVFKASTSYSFSDLPKLVRIGDAVSMVGDRLVDEYIRIGGDRTDSQGLLDFVAGFIQKGIRYPSTISDRSFDYGIHGNDEYWAVPVQTLYHQYGDCEDDSALFCSLASYLGFDVAMGGKAGHVFAGVVLEDFTEVSEQRLRDLGVGYMRHINGTDIEGTSGKTYQAVELIKGQAPVGYSMSIDFGSNTLWGITGFYPADPQGEVLGIHSPS